MVDIFIFGGFFFHILNDTFEIINITHLTSSHNLVEFLNSSYLNTSGNSENKNHFPFLYLSDKQYLSISFWHNFLAIHNCQEEQIQRFREGCLLVLDLRIRRIYNGTIFKEYECNQCNINTPVYVIARSIIFSPLFKILLKLNLCNLRLDFILFWPRLSDTKCLLVKEVRWYLFVCNSEVSWGQNRDM